jgi:polyisoprenyl-teichoic acid--peptidoglycan teichoic acid transferase
MSDRRYTLYRCEESPPSGDGAGVTGKAGVATASAAGGAAKKNHSGRGRANGGRDGAGRGASAGQGGNGRRGNGHNGGRGTGAGGPADDGTPGVPPRQVYAKPRRRWAMVLRYVGLVLVAAICGIAGYWWGWLDSTVAQVSENDKPAVKAAGLELAAQTADEPVNILVLGSDRRDDIQGDVGRSDTMMLVRLDPTTKSISMFSVPRDLWVDIPGYGSERINVAYTLRKQKGAIQVFKQLTGLPIHHFVDVNFLGFIRIVDTLGGVYIDVDQRYYNPLGTGWAAIDLSPGYQLMTGRHALQFVRFRHDGRGDFGRMLRQQVFLHEVERQVKRWENVTKLPALVKAVSKNTISDIDDVTQALGLAKLMLGLDTSHVYKTHVEGEGTMIDGKAVQLPSEQEIKDAVSDFLDPQQAPVATGKISIPRETYTVRVLNGSGSQGLASQVAADLKAQGYAAVEDGNADAFDYTNSVVFTTAGLETSAEAVARMLPPCRVQVVKLLPGTLDGMTVVVGSKYTGVKEPPDTTGVVQAQIQEGVNQDAATWRTWQSKVGIPLEMPTAWSPGMVYDLDQWRSYTIKTPNGQRAAFVAVGHTVSGGYWHVQAMSWTDPPILTDPSEERTVDGRNYSLYYQGARLHRVAWRNGSRVYWVTNTLDDQISNKVLLGLATSCKPVR